MTNVPRSIDCDVHCGPPPLSALAPYLDTGVLALLEGHQFRQPNGIRYTYPDWSPVLATRATDTTLEQISEHVLTQNDRAILSCYYGVESIQNPHAAAALATALNSWIAAEWLDRDDRLLGTALVTPQFTEAAAAEVERVGSDRRFVQVLVPARAWDPYGHPRYWPIWEAAAANELVVAINYGGSVGSTPTPVGWTHSLYEDYALAGQIFQAHLLSLIASGILTRFPRLRFTLLESGLTWLPDFLWLADRDWRAASRELPWVTEAPSEYVRRHVRLTTQPVDGPAEGREQLQDVLRQMGGPELLLFGSDFPHSYSAPAKDLLTIFTAEETERVLWRNAEEHYRLAARAPTAASAA